MPSLARRRFLLASAGLGSLIAAGAGASRLFTAGALQQVERSRHALGTRVKIVALHEDEAAANEAIRHAFEELELVEQLMSIYRPQSQLSRLNRDGVLDDPHPHLVEVLRYAVEVSQQTRGAFDVTVQPLWEAFAEAHKRGELPSPEAVRLAQARVDWRRVDVTERRIQLRGDGTKITLNGIAQGFAADRAMAVLRQHGVKHALIDIGELAGSGRNSAGEDWQVGIQHPREPEAYVALARLGNRCLATSGDYATKFSAGYRYNHLFDPRTGQSPQELASVSIAAPTAMQADALSTASFVLGPQIALGIITALPDVDAMFVLKQERMRTLKTAGFPVDA